MKQWEFDHEYIEYHTWDELIEQLNARGTEGWDIISHTEIITPMDREGGPKRTVVKVLWKRRKTIFVKKDEE